MLSHIHVGVSDFPCALAFYSDVLPELGLVLKFSDPGKPWAAWVSPSAARPLFLIGHPFDGAPHSAGNGQVVALTAPTREAVDRCYASALANGASCEGPPGLRPQYHAHYYGAYFRDLDGNKLCICCHDGPPSLA